MAKKTALKSMIIILALAFVLSGCSLISIRKTSLKPLVKPSVDNGVSRDGPAALSIDEQLAVQTKINKFADLEELKEFLEEGPLSENYDYEGIVMKSMAPMTNMARGDVIFEGLSADASAGSDAGAYDYSQTNAQVEGVDEADIIKTDGKYIYAVANNNLFIMDAYPAESASVLSKIAFRSNPQNIYVNGDYLIVYGQDADIYNTELSKTFKRKSSYTFLKIFDIQDRKNPKQVRDLDFEGNYANSRMIGDYIYFITTYYSYSYIGDETPLPMIIADEETVLNKCVEGQCGMPVPSVYYFDIPYENYNFTTITAVDIKDAKADLNSEVYLLSGSQNMYVSPNNIYITYTKRISEYQLMMEAMKEIVFPRLNAKNQERIAKIEQVENYILSPREKTRKIFAIIERFNQSLAEEEGQALEKEVEAAVRKKYDDISNELEKTVIHKIAINKDELEYKAFGEVTGQVLNQFSMDESGGYFRIATTRNRTWSRFAGDNQQQSYSNLYVLDGDLALVGAVERLAEGERIYSVRFMGGRAYMVTFRQTDPLFVIDLADPKNPKVLGKLKIPGFSNYLHPYDDSTLIGIGKETEENEWGGAVAKGIKLSLFDVSDVANPREIDKYELGGQGSDSIALRDHKAFLFSRDKNILVIPVSLVETGPADGPTQIFPLFQFGGAAVFSVDKNGFKLKGKIDHSDGGKIGEGEYWRGYNYYDNTVKRSLYIGDVLYTFSSKYLKMNNIDDLNLINLLELKKDRTSPQDDFEVVN